MFFTGLTPGFGSILKNEITVDTEVKVKLIPPTYFFVFAFAAAFLLIDSDISLRDSQFKVNFIGPPPPELSFAFAFVILRVNLFGNNIVSLRFHFCVNGT